MKEKKGLKKGRGRGDPREGARRGPLHLGETAEERNTRLGTYVVVGGLVLAAGLAGTAVAVRDARRRHGAQGGHA
ncbi:hypothetical protein GCM10023238_12820 [Streptomyces heliomycini]